MIPLLLILYFCSKSFIIVYFILSYILAVLIYFKATKYYFPNMNIDKGTEENKNKKQYFHEDYQSFSRTELSSISFGWILWGTLNYFLLKAIGSVMSLFFLWVSMKIYFRNRDIKQEFSQGDRENISKIMKFFVGFMYKSMGAWVTEKNITKDEKVIQIYRKYLGANYDPEAHAKEYTTVIANHVSWMDILYLMSKHAASFIAKASVMKIPLVGYVSHSVKTLYIDRASKENRHEILNQIENRQKEKMEGKSYFPLCIYPEGTTSTGRSIITFKKGAFYALTPLKMYIFKTDNRQGAFPVTTGGMNILLHICLSFTFLKNNVEVSELPVFAPNEYLFENFKHLGKDKAEVYSEACRRVMSEVSGFPLSSSSFETKLEYISLIKRKIVKNT